MFVKVIGFNCNMTLTTPGNRVEIRICRFMDVLVLFSFIACKNNICIDFFFLKITSSIIYLFVGIQFLAYKHISAYA